MPLDPADKPAIAVLVETILGATAADDGHSIKVGIVNNEGTKADLLMSTERAVDAVAAIATVLGQAARNRTDNPKVRYLLPAERWEIEQIQDPQTLTLAFLLPGGGEICFQIGKLEARHMHETFGVLLGLDRTMSIPQGQKH